MRQAEKTIMQSLAPIVGVSIPERQVKFRQVVEALASLLTGEDALFIAAVEFTVVNEDRPSHDRGHMVTLDTGRRTLTVHYLDAEVGAKSLNDHLEQGGC